MVSIANLGDRKFRSFGFSSHGVHRTGPARPPTSTTSQNGIVFGAAILIKFYPLVLVPALWQRKDLRMPLTLAVLTVASYACYAGVGRLVFGFLGGDVQEEGIETGTRYFLLELAQRVPGLHYVSVFVYLLLVAMGFVFLGIWSWKAGASESLGRRTGFWLRFFRLPEQAAFLPARSSSRSR